MTKQFKEGDIVELSAHALGVKVCKPFRGHVGMLLRKEIHLRGWKVKWFPEGSHEQHYIDWFYDRDPKYYLRGIKDESR
jgi:hypothetical protein